MSSTFQKFFQLFFAPRAETSQGLSLGEALANLAIILVHVLGVLLVHLAQVDKNRSLNQSILKGSMLFLKMGIVGDESIHSLNRSCAGLATLGIQTMLIAELCILLLVGDGLECHQIQVNKLEFIQQGRTLSLDKIKTRVVSLDVLHTIHPCQLAQDFHSLALSSHTGHSTRGNHFLIQVEILLGIVIISNLVEMFHNQNVCHSDNIAIQIVNGAVIAR